MVPDIFHRDFTPTPYWWEAYTPTAGDLVDAPRVARVAIVGGGYAGLSTALELAKHGIDAAVLEAHELGFGASTRNGGAVSGGVNMGKSFTGRTADVERGFNSIRDQDVGIAEEARGNFRGGKDHVHQHADERNAGAALHIADGIVRDRLHSLRHYGENF